MVKVIFYPSAIDSIREIHIDVDENWCIELDMEKCNDRRETSLLSVLLHEIGDVLGIGHTNVLKSVTYALLMVRK